MARKLGKMMACGQSDTRKKQRFNFYPTQLSAVAAILHAERTFIKDLVMWECATGKDDIAGPLKSNCAAVYTSDITEYLVPRENHFQYVDFLGMFDNKAATLMKNIRACHPGKRVGIMTNPPFDHALEFAWRALHEFECDYLCLFLKATYFNAANRIPLFETYPPTVRYDLTWRVDFTGEGKPTMDGCWVVWDKKRGPMQQWQLLTDKFLLDFYK